MNRNNQLIRILFKIQQTFPYLSNFYIPPNLSKRIYSLYYILEDIRIARLATLKLQKMIQQNEERRDLDDREVFDVIWYGIVTAYARSFTQNKGGFRKLDENIFLEDSALLDIHRKIMSQRHSFIAHRDDTYMTEAVVALIVPEDYTQNRFIVEIQRRAFEETDLENYLRIFDFLDKKIEVLLEGERKRLVLKIQEIGPQKMLDYNLIRTIENLMTKN
jgi:hypothetical protein